MHSFFTRLRTVFSSLLLTSLAVGSAAAQGVVQARSYKNAPTSTYNTINPELAVDASPATAATLSPWLLGGAALRTDFGALVAQGQQVKLLVQSGASGLLSATLLSDMTIRTYSSASTTPALPVQTVSLNSSTITLSLLSGSTSINQVSFVTTASFDQLEIWAGGAIQSAVSVYAEYATVAPLPVQLTAFLGKATETGVALKWETASEHNAAYFEVQRAEGLSDDFQSLGQVKCAGSSTQSHTYQFVDAASAGLHYYRLRQVDMDGTETFSPVVTVSAGLLAGLTAYPTLATHTLNITGPAGTHLNILNQQGQQVQVADLAASQQQLDVSSLPSGVYFLRDANTGLTARFVKAGGER